MKKNMGGATPYRVMFRSGLMKIKFIQKMNVYVYVCMHTYTHTHKGTQHIFLA